MREIWHFARTKLAARQPFAVATVVSTWGSAPRGIGAKMAVDSEGQLAGSVSGGCVEGAIVEIAQEVLRSGNPELVHFGVADETAWGVGLACGGEIEVFVERLDNEVLHIVDRWLEEDDSGVLATVIAGPETSVGRKLVVGSDSVTVGSVGQHADAEAIAKAKSALSDGKSRRVRLTNLADPMDVFLDVLQPPKTLIMVGGVHISVALTSIANGAGYRTIVVDPRRAFGSTARFAHADRLLQGWPKRVFAEIKLTPTTAVAVLTHDPKIDDEALKIVLASPAFYVGALGSKNTQAKRRDRLENAGLDRATVDRIRGPIGIDIGAEDPEEIAVAIMAEIVAAWHGRLEAR